MEMVIVPSRRVIDQRIRNRIMETAELFAHGAEGVRAFGSGSGWFNWFFDSLWEAEDLDRLSTLTALEREQFKNLWHLVDQGCSATGPIASADELIATGWPDRIAPVAKGVLDTMVSRGVFSEEVEEDEPSQSWVR